MTCVGRWMASEVEAAGHFLAALLLHVEHGVLFGEYPGYDLHFIDINFALIIYSVFYSPLHPLSSFHSLFANPCPSSLGA